MHINSDPTQALFKKDKNPNNKNGNNQSIHNQKIDLNYRKPYNGIFCSHYKEKVELYG